MLAALGEWLYRAGRELLPIPCSRSSLLLLIIPLAYVVDRTRQPSVAVAIGIATGCYC
ncbi:MAG: hypothetical protein R3C56_29475 [Pirellulaceae bacterium]